MATAENEWFRLQTRLKYEQIYKRVVLGDEWDIVSIDSLRGIVTLIQCKVCDSDTTARRLIKNFRSNPPYAPMAYVHQVMEVKVKGSKEVHSVTI